MSTKVVNSLKETVRIAESSLSWGGTIEWAILFNKGTPKLLWVTELFAWDKILA